MKTEDKIIIILQKQRAQSIRQIMEELKMPYNVLPHVMQCLAKLELDGKIWYCQLSKYYYVK